MILQRTKIEIIHYRSSFLPVILGAFQPDRSGTTVSMQIVLHAVVIVFMRICFFGVGMAAFAALPDFSADKLSRQ
jgi:hypothetical protein